MRSSHPAVAAIAALALTVSLHRDARAELVLPRVSQSAKVEQTIGVTNLSLSYSRPGVKGRAIWGALVPYDKPWRTGANDATVFTTSGDISIAGQKLPAGTYSFFTIPGASQWTLIFSKQKDQWGAYDYDRTQDQLRVTATPSATGDSQEWLWLGFDGLSATGGEMVIRWEKLRVAVPISVEVNETVLASARTEIAAAKPDDWRTPYRAASWTFDSGVAPEEGRGWLERSLGVQAVVQNLGLKARWLAKDGKTADAITVGNKAIAAGKAAKETDITPGLEKQVAEWQASLPASGKAKKSRALSIRITGAGQCRAAPARRAGRPIRSARRDRRRAPRPHP